MSTLSKEAIETGTTKDTVVSGGSAGVSPASSPVASAAGQIHSDAVSLEVALKVHGSKVSGGARGVSGQTEPFEEETSSMIVFSHGGVLRMATPVNIGQMLVVTNLKTRQDAICRVVKVRNYSNSASYVEVEFTSKQPGYWGVYFESEAPEVAPAASTPGSSLTSSVFESKAVPNASPVSDDSTFVSFGSQEEVQPSASSTTSSASASGVSSRKSPGAVSETATAKKPADTSGSVTASAAMMDVDSESTEPRSAKSAAEVFGSRLSGGNASEEQSTGGKNWLAIGAGGAVLLAAIVGGALFINHKPAAAPASSTPSVAQQAPVSQPQPVSEPSPSPAVTPSNATSRANVTPSVSTQPASSTRAPRQIAVVRESPAVSEPAAQPQPAPAPAAASTTSEPASRSSMPSVFGTLNAHPVAPSRNLSAAAPNVEASAPSMPDNAVLGITGPSNTAASLPAPAVSANTPPLPVGGRVKQPVIAKTVAPQYPSLAKQAHTQGDVTVQIVIDRAGNVTEGKAISGPPVLRQAAIEAVRNWKFQPSVLDGQPISVQTLVTVRFQL